MMIVIRFPIFYDILQNWNKDPSMFEKSTNQTLTAG